MDHEHLLEQAERLATADPGRPRTASLKRAVSTAYYAVFHHRVNAAVRHALGARRDAAGTRRLLARGYSHEGLRATSAAFIAGVGGWPAWMRDAVEGTGLEVPPELRTACRPHVRLHTLREAADYDPGWRTERGEVLFTITQARQAITLFDAARPAPAARFFLAAAPLWDTLRRRRGGT